MPTWNPELGPGDVITGLLLLSALGALLFTAWQLRESIKIRRAQFLLSATDRYFSDEEVRKLYYDIDYGRFEIQFDGNGEPATFKRGAVPSNAFIGSAEERCLDQLLYTFDIIGRIVEVGALNQQEARLFVFQAKRVFSDISVRKLLAWLDRERERFGGEVPAHKAGRALAERTI